MSEQVKLFGDVCRNNHGGNKNSERAYRDTRTRSLTDILLLLKLISEAGREGRTADELTIESELYIQTCSARCSEMKRDKLVEEIGLRKTRRGSLAGVLMLTGKGEQALINGKWIKGGE